MFEHDLFGNDAHMAVLLDRKMSPSQTLWLAMVAIPSVCMLI